MLPVKRVRIRGGGRRRRRGEGGERGGWKIVYDLNFKVWRLPGTLVRAFREIKYDLGVGLLGISLALFIPLNPYLGFVSLDYQQRAAPFHPPRRPPSAPSQRSLIRPPRELFPSWPSFSRSSVSLFPHGFQLRQ